MVLQWFKEHATVLITILACAGFGIYCYSCEPKVQSLTPPLRQINRQELQLEFDQIMSLAQLRMLDLDKQEQFRSIILQNALILVQGQPFNPVGIITAIAAIYGIGQAGTTVSKKVKNTIDKRKANNGQS